MKESEDIIDITVGKEHKEKEKRPDNLLRAAENQSEMKGLDLCLLTQEIKTNVTPVG